jgi:hypothetical protein
LNECCWACRTIDSVKTTALLGDVASLMNAPEEVTHALAVLCQPIEAEFLQRDLNVLGAEPPLPEDGRMGRETTEAIRSIQSAFGQSPTGVAGPETAAAVRYSVGVIYSQDRSAHGGG